MKKILLCLAVGGLAFAQQYFPISAFHVDDTLWFEGAGEDSLGLNHIWIGGGERNDAVKIRKLQLAEDEGLYGTLYHALRGTQSGPNYNHNEIAWYYCLFWTNWEVDSSNFYQYTGTDTSDASAQGNDAWIARKGVDTPGQMIKGPKRETRARTVGFFDIDFILKIDSLGTSTDSVCSLWVKTEEGMRTWDVVIVDDFNAAGEYDTITLSYDNGDETNLHYGIHWYGNRTLWADYIETKDRYIEAVVDSHYYDTTLVSIFSRYDTLAALKYYYLMDEPDVGHFAANAYLMWFLDEHDYDPGIQTVSLIEPQIYELYVDSVKPNVLLVNYYPLRGAHFGQDSTPWEKGPKFQGRLDTMCMEISKARKEAKQNNKPFWFMHQSFGQYDTATGLTKYHREPTPREIKCMIWLALAHGAQGIEHFTYKTIPEGSWIDSGLTCNGNPRYPLWTAAKEMNFLIRDIGSKLLSLESDTVFKSTEGIPPSCFIKEISSDDTVQIGTFHNADNDTFFIIVNRLCQASDSDTVVIKIHKDSLFLTDLYTGEAIAPDSEPNGNSYFSIPLPPAQGRFFQLIPFAQDFKINDNQAYANMVHVALDTKAWAYASVDSMKIWQNYNDSLVDATGWMPYDTVYCRQLRQGEGTNTMYIQYKIDGNINSPEYSDVIMYDKTAPTYSFVINDDSTFTNTSNVTLKSSLTDATSGPSKMRYGNKELKNPVKNSAFDNADDWSYDHATYDDTLKLYEIPVQITGNYFFQAIPPESLEAFEEDTMLLWIDLVSDDFNGTGRIEFQYIYGDTAVRHVHPVGCTISIPEGTNAKVSEYNLYSFFEFRPDSNSVFIEARVGLWIDNDLGNTGTLYIDNFRLDIVGPADDYTRFENYDSLKEWNLITGNGVRKVYGQFSDGAGNETAVSFDSIIVDTTKPARRISYPQNGQTISDTITITGWAHDSLDDPPHFKQYELQHQSQMSANWYGNDPNSISYTPKYPIQVGQGQKPVALGDWNTTTVNDGWYNLKLTVADSASNSRDTTISVNVNNEGDGDGKFSGFSNYVYGLAAGNDVYIGECNTGKIYQYNANYELIDTFTLVDSIGTGFPLAITVDDSGKLWVANTNSHLISKFTPQGSLLLQFPGGFSMPSGIAFDNSSNIWVSDRLHHKIKKFNQDGDSLFAFGSKGSEPGEIDRPIGIAFFDNKIYIADSKNKRVSVFDTLGDFIEVIADSAGLQMPFGLAIDSSGCLFVSDFRGNQVIEFDPYSNQLYKIDSILDSPTGLALSPDANILYVSDTRNKRVLAFQVRGEPPAGGGPQAYGDVYIDRLMFDVYPSLSAKQMNIRLQGFVGRKISLKVYDVTGRLIKTFYDNQMIKANQSISWDCKDDINRKLANGVYFVRLVTQGHNETRKAILLK